MMIFFWNPLLRPLLRDIGGSTFHARHHQDLRCNFGFYTLIWDRLFGTLRKDYFTSMGVIPSWVTANSECQKAGHSGP